MFAQRTQNYSMNCGSRAVCLHVASKSCLVIAGPERDPELSEEDPAGPADSQASSNFRSNLFLLEVSPACFSRSSAICSSTTSSSASTESSSACTSGNGQH
ncbi:hypothetical protein DPEC_G00111980 [Dallia pectoralis]|uniref:Uncharacterized protein n=1 Tax=Dallia pectoralis TaxID=75939 RepID=A0ACC2GTK0_DALPE|nr:hypothetical protein DPEC_G00111980 [Dallia pectoralis]